jgi:hypothetical protein
MVLSRAVCVCVWVHVCVFCVYVICMHACVNLYVCAYSFLQTLVNTIYIYIHIKHFWIWIFYMVRHVRYVVYMYVYLYVRLRVGLYECKPIFVFLCEHVHVWDMPVCIYLSLFWFVFFWMHVCRYSSVSTTSILITSWYGVNIFLTFQMPANVHRSFCVRSVSLCKTPWRSALP